MAAVFVLAANPVFDQQAVWCFAHMAVTFCLIWGLFFLVCWSERGRLLEAFLAGLFLGCIPAIRYPEALFVLGVAVFLFWHLRSRKRIWLHYAAAVAGAALPLVPLLIRNHVAFGAFYRTAYALTNEQTGFSWAYFKSHFVGYIRGLHGEGVGLFFPLGMIGMTMMCCVRRWRRAGVLLLMLDGPVACERELYIPWRAPRQVLFTMAGEDGPNIVGMARREESGDAKERPWYQRSPHTAAHPLGGRAVVIGLFQLEAFRNPHDRLAVPTHPGMLLPFVAIRRFPCF